MDAIEPTRIDSRRKILVIDDEDSYRALIGAILGDDYQVISAVDGSSGLGKAMTEHPDLILLDIRLPGVDGVSTCEALRLSKATRHIPIIVMTAFPETNERIKSFFAGADDFISKPFLAKELQARVDSKIRRVREFMPAANRSQTASSAALMKLGNLVLDTEKLELQVAGKPVVLTMLEFQLLKYLIQNRTRVSSRRQILESVWKNCIVSERTVDTHVVALRKKLRDFDHTLMTIYGAGYILKEIRTLRRPSDLPELSV